MPLNIPPFDAPRRCRCLPDAADTREMPCAAAFTPACRPFEVYAILDVTRHFRYAAALTCRRARYATPDAIFARMPLIVTLLRSFLRLMITNNRIGQTTSHAPLIRHRCLIAFLLTPLCRLPLPAKDTFSSPFIITQHDAAKRFFIDAAEMLHYAFADYLPLLSRFQQQGMRSQHRC